MRNSHGTFETRKRSFISAFSICMTVPLSKEVKQVIQRRSGVTGSAMELLRKTKRAIIKTLL